MQPGQLFFLKCRGIQRFGRCYKPQPALVFHKNQACQLNTIGDKTMGDVGSYMVFENDKIMIWELVLEPGQQTACHTHRHDYTPHGDICGF